MDSPISRGFTKSLIMTVLSEVGDRTFCVAAILAMRHPRRSVLLGCLSSVIVMTVVSVAVGWAAPNLISRKHAHNITTFLFISFGLRSLREAYNEDDDDNEELEQVEKELDKQDAVKGLKTTTGSKPDADLQKKQKRSFLTHFFSPVFFKAFSITFFGEWGDEPTTIGLAAAENTVGGDPGWNSALCTVAAIIGGRSLASRISERLVTLLGGVLFLIFGVQSFLSPD